MSVLSGHTPWPPEVPSQQSWSRPLPFSCRTQNFVTFARLYKLPVPAVLLIRILGVVGVVRKLSDVEADVDVVPAMTATNVYYSYLLCR